MARTRTQLALAAPVLLLLALTIAACEGGEQAATPTPSPSPSPTPSPSPATTPTPTPTPTGGTIADFRKFAADIEAALKAGDVQFFLDRAIIQKETCTGTEELGPCAGQAEGSEVSGIPFGIWATDVGGFIPPQEYAQRLQEFFAAALPQESDEFGAGAVTLHSLAAERYSPFDPDRPAFMTLVTAIVPAGFLPEVTPAAEGEKQRVLKVLQFSFQDDRWRFLGELDAGVMASDWLSGECRECYNYWEAWQGETP